MARTETKDGIPKAYWKLLKRIKGNDNPTVSANDWTDQEDMQFLKSLLPTTNHQPPTIDHEPIIFDPFSLKELEDFLSKKNKDSAPGIDGIMYSMIKKMNEVSKTNLVNALTSLLIHNNIPDSWRQFKIIPIPKKGKDLSVVTNFRPITLISILQKVANGMIKNRFTRWLEDFNIIPQNSFAYQKNRSTATCINAIQHDILNSKAKGKKVILAVCDIQKAYDFVNLNKLNNILILLLCPDELRRWIINFFSERTLCKGNSSIVCKAGIPQGSLLSPSIFNVYSRDLHCIADEDTSVYQYADDFVIISAKYSQIDAVKNLQNKLQTFKEKIHGLDLQINMAKTQIMCANRTKSEVTISVNNVNIKSVKELTFLGRVLHESQSSTKHLQTAIKSVEKYCNLLKIICNVKKGLHPKRSIGFYKAYIRSRIEYVYSSTADCPKYIMRKIVSMECGALRSCLGLMRTTPLHDVFALAGELPPEYRGLFISAKELTKAIHHGLPFTEQIKNSDRVLTTYDNIFARHGNLLLNLGNYISCSKSPLIKCFPNTIRDCGLNKDEMSSQELQSLYENIKNGLTNQNFKIISTDASVNLEWSGFGVVDWAKRPQQASRFYTNRKMNTNEAELTTILLACNHAIEENYQKVALFTDSKTACNQILKSTNSTAAVINKLCSEKNLLLNIYWTPAHKGITINEEADIQAKAARTNGTEIKVAFTIAEVLKEFESFYWNEWQKEYELLSQTKGKFVFEGFPKLSKNCWFAHHDFTAEEVRTINRLFTNQTFFSNHIKNKIDPTEIFCPLCSCTNDNNHIIFDCLIYNYQRNHYCFQDNFKSIQEIAKSTNENSKRKALHEIIDFIKKIKIRM